MFKTNTQIKRTLISALIAAAALIAAPAAYATNASLGDWRSLYPNSNSDDAGCQLCHGASTSYLNTYGRDLCLEIGGTRPVDWSDALMAIEGIDSDLDPNSSNNLLEISNYTQPGWTTGMNPLYQASGLCAEIAADSTVPGGVPLPYDLVVSGDPIANPGGPYEALVGDEIHFDGSGSTDDGTIEFYDWDFGDGNYAIDGGVDPVHIYTLAGIYNVTLSVTDDEGNINLAETTASIENPELLDLDIAKFSVTKGTRVGKDVTIKLSVANNGSVLGQAIATVVGLQNDIEVYNRRLNVFDDIGKGTTSFKFQDYTAAASGPIYWTVRIADGDPDIDEATAITSIK